MSLNLVLSSFQVAMGDSCNWLRHLLHWNLEKGEVVASFNLFENVLLPSSVLKGFTSAHLGEFQKELNSAVLKDMRANKDNISVTVLAVDIARKESEWLMHGCCIPTGFQES